MFPLAGHKVLKMNGLGNEIVVLDLRGSAHVVTPAEARVTGRGEGLLFDQLMVLHDPRTPGTEAFVLIYNIDGSEAGACGNGTRCVAWLLAGETGKNAFAVETRAGVLACARLADGRFRVDMGAPRLDWSEIPLAAAVTDTARVALDTAFLKAGWPMDFGAVSMGNPHAIFFVTDVEAHDLARTGPMLEVNPMFPQRANISLAAVTSRSSLNLKVWERGAGLTRACGSGACAAAVAAHRRGLTGREVAVRLPGGVLDIHWRADGGVSMTGPVEWEFEAALPASLFEAAA
ncbi:MAG: diaminopimelate epimerase [Beijerinckiaceae bacterium]